jgi:hypothetical protein
MPSALLIAGCSCFDFVFDARKLRRGRFGRHSWNALSLNIHISQSSEASLILAFSISFVEEKPQHLCRASASATVELGSPNPHLHAAFSLNKYRDLGKDTPG